MTCKTIIDGKGVTVIACTRGGRREPCSTPGCTNAATLLCDYPLAPMAFGQEPKTCDRKLCPRCAVKMGPNSHYCQPHARRK